MSLNFIPVKLSHIQLPLRLYLGALRAIYPFSSTISYSGSTFWWRGHSNCSMTAANG